MKNRIEKKLKLNKTRLNTVKKEQEAAGGPEKHTFWGDWILGYYEGKVAAIQDILDMYDDEQ